MMCARYMSSSFLLLHVCGAINLPGDIDTTDAQEAVISAGGDIDLKTDRTKMLRRIKDASPPRKSDALSDGYGTGKANASTHRFEACAQLLVGIENTEDVHECLTGRWGRSGDYIFNHYCSSLKHDCQFVPSFTANTSMRIAIVNVDSRSKHPGHDMWTAYAQKHGYKYIQTTTHMDLSNLPVGYRQPVMLSDWESSHTLKTILEDPTHKEITHFMYVEVDQFVSRPMAKLEPLFEEAGLTGGSNGNIMALVDEFPCTNIRNGGHFNAGMFLFARDDRMKRVFDTWYDSQAFGGREHPKWPGRQGALTVSVYPEFKDVIHNFANACPFGSPFGGLVSHVTTGGLAAYNPGPGRRALPIIHKCIERRLRENDKRPCAFYPKWLQGRCLSCDGELKVDIEGETRTIPYSGCCGDVDSALPMEAFTLEAKAGLLQSGVKVDLEEYTPDRYASVISKLAK